MKCLQILDYGDEMLQNLLNDFQKLRARPHDFRVACFYETRSTDISAIGGIGGRMVSL